MTIWVALGAAASLGGPVAVDVQRELCTQFSESPIILLVAHQRLLSVVHESLQARNVQVIAWPGVRTAIQQTLTRTNQ